VKNFDAILVGGGIIGCSIARELARRKLRVVLLDRQQPGRESSWAAAGMLTPAAESEESLALVPFATASLDLYTEFVAGIEQATGKKIDYRRDGSLQAFFGEGAESRRDEWLAFVRGAGFDPQPLSAGELRRMEPVLSDDAAAGAFLRGDGAVDNRQLTEAVADAAQREGVEICTGAEVLRVLCEGTRAAGVETRSERYTAAHVVVAAGCYSSQIEGAARYAPTLPARGQMAALRPAKMPVRRVVRGPVYLVPRADGRLLAGATVEHAGYEKSVTAAGISGILTGAARMVPELAGAPIVETWSGLRPDTPDHLPILGPTDVQGLWIATGHFRNGILLAPATAQAMAEWMTQGNTTLPVRGFSPMRFVERAQPIRD
jgi:glycine oxidase